MKELIDFLGIEYPLFLSFHNSGEISSIKQILIIMSTSFIVYGESHKVKIVENNEMYSYFFALNVDYSQL